MEIRPIKLFEILESYAPKSWNGEVYYSKLKKTYKKNTELERALVATLYDGLAYGNWPWVIK
jgi:hypothetical protein